MVAAISDELEVAIPSRPKQSGNTVIVVVSGGLEVAVSGRPKQSGNTVIVAVSGRLKQQFLADWSSFWWTEAIW